MSLAAYCHASGVVGGCELLLFLGEKIKNDVQNRACDVCVQLNDVEILLCWCANTMYISMFT